MNPEDDKTIEEGKQALRDIKDTLKAGGADVAAEARAAGDDVRSAAADMAGTARETGAKVGQHAGAAKISAGVALDEATQIAAERAGEAMDETRALLAEWEARAEQYVRAKPMPALAAAAAAGLLLGLYLRGSRR